VNESSTSSVVLDRELEEDKKPGASEPPRIRCPLCGWSPARKTNGCAHAAMSGIRSIPEASAPPVFTSGLKPNASRTADGRRIRIGNRGMSLLGAEF